MSKSDIINQVITYTYRFLFNDNTEKTFTVNIEPNTLNAFRSGKGTPPSWAKLENFECPHCPINKDEYEYCPVAVNLEDVIKFFNKTPSYEEVKIIVESKERTYIKDSDVQVGVSSILGILMVTSGCPILGKLKPLVKFHLPFSTIEETEFRVFSTYLLEQFIKNKRGDKPDWEMKNLKSFYADLQKLNYSVADKISKISEKDSLLNAVVVLNNFADSVTLSLDEDDVPHLTNYFKDLF